MISQWIIHEPEDGNYQRCIIALPGRGNSAELMVKIARDLQIPQTLVVALRPWYSAWYPQPFSAEDQEDAIKGIPKALQAVNQAIQRVIDGFKLPYNRIALLGYSAGGVMAIQTAVHRMHVATKHKTHKPCFAGAVIYCGAILEPEQLPLAPGIDRPTPFFLVHNQDDECFNWWERYIPMKSALYNCGYQVQTSESMSGGHMIKTPDIFRTSRFLGRCFGIQDWEHPYEKTWYQKQMEAV